MTEQINKTGGRNDPTSHSEMKEIFHSTLKSLFETDSVLNDLHCSVTHQEVQGLIEVEKGRSILVTVLKENGEEFALRVPRDSRVHHLKSALKTKVTLDLQRKGMNRSINWRYVWHRHALHNPENGALLTDENALLEHLGVTHKTLLTFKPIKRKKR